MSEYKRLTKNNIPCSVACREFGGKHEQYYYRLAELEDKLESGLLLELPLGWLETLKLLTSAAVCYARIKDLITSRMSQSKDISELFFDCPTVQGVVLDLALSELSEAKIDFNNITGFEELLNTMPHFKEIAERSELARLKELQRGSEYGI